MPLQEGDQGGGEGCQLLLVALGHLSHSCPITCPVVHSLWWIVTWARNIISSSRDSLNWSGVSSKTASVDLVERIVVDKLNFVSSLYSLEVSELLLKFLFIRLSIPLDQVLSRGSIRIKKSWKCFGKCLPAVGGGCWATGCSVGLTSCQPYCHCPNNLCSPTFLCI